VSRNPPAIQPNDTVADDLVNVAENASQRVGAHQEIRRFEDQEAYLKRKCEMAREQGECLLKGERLVIKCSKCHCMLFEIRIVAMLNLVAKFPARKADGSFRYSFDTLM
jgi:hypothetical protein